MFCLDSVLLVKYICLIVHSMCKFTCFSIEIFKGNEANTIPIHSKQDSLIVLLL